MISQARFMELMEDPRISVPVERYTEEELLFITACKPTNVLHVRNPSEDMIMASIMNGCPLNSLPLARMTQEHWAMYVKRNPEYIGEIPEEYLNQSLVDMAISEIPGLFWDIPKKYRSTYVFTVAATKNPKDVLPLLTKEKLNWTLVFDVLQENPKAFRWFPEELQNEEMVDLAILSDPWNIMLVRRDLRLVEYTCKAIQANPKIFRILDEEGYFIPGEKEEVLQKLYQDYKESGDLPGLGTLRMAKNFQALSNILLDSPEDFM